MLDFIASIYELPICCFFDAAKDKSLELRDRERFMKLYREFSTDIQALSSEQIAKHAELFYMIHYVKRCFDTMQYAK